MPTRALRLIASHRYISKSWWHVDRLRRSSGGFSGRTSRPVSALDQGRPTRDREQTLCYCLSEKTVAEMIRVRASALPVERLLGEGLERARSSPSGIPKRSQHVRLSSSASSNSNRKPVILRDRRVNSTNDQTRSVILLHTPYDSCGRSQQVKKEPIVTQLEEQKLKNAYGRPAWLGQRMSWC
jgi:hypothetical protein